MYLRGWSGAAGPDAAFCEQLRRGHERLPPTIRPPLESLDLTRCWRLHQVGRRLLTSRPSVALLRGAPPHLTPAHFVAEAERQLGLKLRCCYPSIPPLEPHDGGPRRFIHSAYELENYWEYRLVCLMHGWPVWTKKVLCPYVSPNFTQGYRDRERAESTLYRWGALLKPAIEPDESV